MICILKHPRKNFTQVVDYTRRGCYRSQFKMQKGETIFGFELIHSQYYKDFDLTHFHFKNNSNLLNYHHLDCSQELNTTSLVIPTPFLKTNAINYAVQKMIQCGSKGYPVRSIINEMRARSLNQINNTVTTEEYIALHFQTHSRKDHSNLLRVYFQTLFNPLLRKEDFNEIIYRLSLQNNQLNNPLQIVGELAKQMQTSNQFIQNRIHKMICSQLLGINKLSTCLPQQLINLSFSDVNQFHRQYFTLSNLNIITHGDFNPALTIQELDSIIKSKKIHNHSIPAQPLQQKKLTLPKSVQLDHLQMQVPLILAYTIDAANHQQKILLSILSYILYQMPQSPLLKWNSPSTPYPKLYGYQDKYFVIGVTFDRQPTQKQFYERQKQIIGEINQLIRENISNSLIEKALMHLEGAYYRQNGLQIIQSCITPLLISKQQISPIFQVTTLISKLLKTYRQSNLFENLLSKHIIQNQRLIRITGRHNPHLIEDQFYKTSQFCSQLKSKMSSQELIKLTHYKQPSILQNTNSLPSLSLTDIQIFDEMQPEETLIKDVKTFWRRRPNGTKINIKIDVTDIGEDNFNMLGIFCESYGKMGINSITSKAYREIMDKNLQEIGMTFEAIRDSKQSMKIYLFLTIEFSHRNFEYGFSVLHGLIHEFNYKNFQALSVTIQRAASKCYNDVSQDIVHYHGLHLAASKCPFSQIQDPLFHARSVCNLASEILKVGNPKHFLEWVSQRLKLISQKMLNKNKWEILVESSKGTKNTYSKYLELLLGELKNQSQKVPSINILNYQPTNLMKYFPNYNQQIVFQGFSIPYLGPGSPALLVLSNIINRNIKKFNDVGGCFIHKGAMVAFLGGTRKKVLELEEYYKKIDEIDYAKRAIFQHMAKHPFQRVFKTGMTNQQARIFKQSVLMTTEQEINQVLETYIVQKLKQSQSSILALGPHLKNYEPLLKKGWQIQRSIDQTSLNMESQSNRLIQFKESRYMQL